MKRILILIVTSFTFLQSSAQTLNLDFVEKCFTLSKKALLDSLKKEGFKNLTDEEIYKEEILLSDDLPPDIKPKIYSPKGVRKIYELRQKFGGGMCKVSLVMKEPEYNKLSSIFWNSNLQYSGGSYAGQLKELNYHLVEDPYLEIYRNDERGFEIIVVIKKRYNVINFTMSRIRK